MKLLWGLLLAGAGGMAQAKVITCAGLLASERARLRAGVTRALATPEAMAADPFIKRLDEDILTWAEGELAQLSKQRRDRALTIIERASLGSPFRTKYLKAHLWLENSHGHLFVEDKRIHLVIDAFETQSEASRFTFRHELTHLKRFIEPGSAQRTARRVHRLIKRPMGQLLEEGFAFRDDYRYLRRNYAAADVERLANRASGVDEMIGVAARRGFLRRHVDDPGVDIDLAYVRTDEDQTLLFRILTAEADIGLSVRVARSLRMTESEWVRAALTEFREQTEN